MIQLIRLCVLVPIIPTYLFEQEHPDAFARIDGRDNSSGLRPSPECTVYSTVNISVPGERLAFIFTQAHNAISG